MFITDSFCYIPECFLGNSAGKESICKEGDPGLIPGWGSSPGEGTEYPLQYPYLENPYGQRSLEGYSPWSCKESNKTERLSTANRHPKLTQHCKSTISLVQFSNSVISTSLGPNGLQHHHLPETAQTCVLRVRDLILPSHPLSSPSPPAFNHFQHPLIR